MTGAPWRVDRAELLQQPVAARDHPAAHGSAGGCAARPDANDLLHLKYVYGVSPDRNNADIASQTITSGAHSFQQGYTMPSVINGWRTDRALRKARRRRFSRREA